MLLKWKKRRSVRLCSQCRIILSINDYPVSDGAGAASHGLCDSCMSRLAARDFASPASLLRLRSSAG